MATTLIQAQQRFIGRVNSCHTGHRNRVSRAAWSELYRWAKQHGYEAMQICQDASDVAKIERNCDE